MKLDYDSYKHDNLAFDVASKYYTDTAKAVEPPKARDRPSNMATYGPGTAYTASGHRTLIDPAGEASRLAYT